MKKYIRTICWLAGALIWIIVSGIYFSEGKTGFAIVQSIIAILLVINAVREYFKQRKLK